MSSRRTALTPHVNFRIPPEMMSAIRDSGQSAGAWFRQAGQQRLDIEGGNDTPMGRLERQVSALQKTVQALQENHATLLREINRVEQSQAVNHQGVLREMGQLQQTQASGQEAVKGYVAEVEQRVSDALTLLGPTLLTALSQQLDHQLGRPARTERQAPAFQARTDLKRTQL